MQKSIAFKILLISGIGFLSFACDSEVAESRSIDEKFSKPATNNLAIKRKRALLKAFFDAKKKQDSMKIVEEKKEEAKIAFPYTLAPEFSELQKTLTNPIGKVSGGIFGTDNDVYAVLKAQCGEGSILQVVFKSGPTFQISPPIPVRFIGLNTQKPVSYSEGGFKITVNFSKDQPEQLKGNFRIDFVDDDGNKKNYINLSVDGAPLPFLLPTQMKGEGSLPTYDSCTPTAYVGIKRPSKDWVYGYAHIHNISNLNIPKVRLMFSDRDGMDLLLVPLKRGQEIPANSEVDVETARKRGQNPAVLKIETWRIDEISEPENATGVNLRKLTKTLLLNGKAVVALKKDQPWNVDIQVKDFSISPLMMGPFQDEAFSEIRIFGNLGVDGQMKSSLPEKPDWWKKKSSAEAPAKDPGTTDKP